MHVILDGIGENEAFIKTDDGIMTIPRHRIPEEARVGDCLLMKDGMYVLDARNHCGNKE